jgi:hypothetical protein
MSVEIMNIPPSVMMNAMIRKLQPLSPQTVPESNVRIKLCHILSTRFIGSAPSCVILNPEMIKPAITTTKMDMIAKSDIIAIGPLLI